MSVRSQFTQKKLTKLDDIRQQRGYIEQMGIISEALGISHKPEADLLNHLNQLYPGTCEWITKHEKFLTWAWDDDDVPDNEVRSEAMVDAQPRVFWLNGGPGSGKSISAAHVIKHLSDNNINHSYFFFKANVKATLTRLLLSLAFQMAESNFEVRHTLLNMIRISEISNFQDHTLIWNNVFLSRIFKVSFSEPHFWVIDALDECAHKSLEILLSMLGRLDTSIPLRIFITSRMNDHLEHLFEQERIDFIDLHTGEKASMNDIRAYVGARIRLSPDEDEGSMLSEILRRCDGNFLWASLMVQKLNKIWAVEDRKKALEEVPSEMNGHYRSMLERVTSGENAEVARCALTWVVCAPIHLETEALKEAVKLDIGRTMTSFTPGFIAETCGNLLTVDSENHVQVMHQTVKDFLTSEHSDTYINVRRSHERLARICLTHLSSGSFLAGGRRRPESGPSSGLGSGFDGYAAGCFSFHLNHSHSTSRDLLVLLNKFMDRNILAWIEKIAASQSLAPLSRAVRNLSTYASRQLDASPPFDSNYKKAIEWTSDLGRVISIFGPGLLDSPSSIYTLVPTLCPTSSIIFKTFGSKSRQKFISATNEEWDARLACLQFPKTTKAMASNSKYHAVGLTSGAIRIFSASSLEDLATLQHGEPVRHLAFGSQSNMLVSCSVGKLTLWDSELQRLWTTNLPKRPTLAFSVYFSSDDSKLFVCVRGNPEKAIFIYHTSDGGQVESLQIPERDTDSEEEERSDAARRRYIPEVLRLSPILEYAMISFRSSHPILYDLQADGSLYEIGPFNKDEDQETSVKSRPPDVLDVAFSPAVDLGMVALSYQDGELVTARLSRHRPGAIKQSVYRINTRALAASPDGSTLAAGNNNGSVVLFEFDTLQPLQTVAVLDENVAGILFGHNSRRLYDVRGTFCNVWEPSELARKRTSEDGSSESEQQIVVELETKQFDEKRTISAMAQASDDHYLFCGREDGSVSLYDATTGAVLWEVELHAAIIHHLAWNAHTKSLMSVDAAGRCLLTHIGGLESHSHTGPKRIVDDRVNTTVVQALLHPKEDAVLLSMLEYDVLLRPGVEPLRGTCSPGRGNWLQHPTESDSLLHSDGERLHLHSWIDLNKKTHNDGMQLLLPDFMHDLPLTGQWASKIGLDLLVRTVQIQADGKTTGFLTLNPTRIDAESDSVEVSGTIKKLMSGVKAILGIQGTNLYFLSRSNWICSMSTKLITGSSGLHYTRHFFIPSFWQSTSPLTKIVSRHSVASAYRDNLAIFHGFLSNDTRIYFDQVP